MSKSIPYDACLIYKTVYERVRGRGYTIAGRDLKEAKTLIDLNSDIDLASIEHHALEYFKGKNKFWADKEFPAYGLFMQFNENAPRVQKKVREYCRECFSEHYTDEPCRSVQPASPQVVREALEEMRKLGDKFGKSERKDE